MSSDEFVETVQGMSSKNLGQINMSQYSRAKRRMINDELAHRSNERKAKSATLKLRLGTPSAKQLISVSGISWEY